MTQPEKDTLPPQIQLELYMYQSILKIISLTPIGYALLISIKPNIFEGSMADTPAEIIDIIGVPIPATIPFVILATIIIMRYFPDIDRISTEIVLGAHGIEIENE